MKSGGGTSRSRSGRPPILTDRDKRHIVRIVRSNRQYSARTVASLSTIKRALYEANYHSRVAVRKPLISATNRQHQNGRINNGRK